MATSFDHFIYAGRDLDAISAQFEQMTGVAPGRGGRHPGMGTHNALASLGNDVYFELLAIDPTQKDRPQGTMGARIDALPSPRLFAYMLKAQDLAQQQKVLASHGIGAELFDSSRTTPDGRTLRWRLLVPHDNPFGDFVPKFIDWLDTRTPPPARSRAAPSRASRSATPRPRNCAACSPSSARAFRSTSPTGPTFASASARRKGASSSRAEGGA